MLCACNERRSVHKTDLPKMNTNVTIRHTPLNVHIWLKSAFWEVKETTSKMPLHFTILYFLVVLLYVTYVHGAKSPTASADIEQLKLNYQHMNTKLQNLVNENQRLNSEVTRLQTRASKSFLAVMFVNTLLRYILVLISIEPITTAIAICYFNCLKIYLCQFSFLLYDYFTL